MADASTYGLFFGVSAVGGAMLYGGAAATQTLVVRTGVTVTVIQGIENFSTGLTPTLPSATPMGYLGFAVGWTWEHLPTLVIPGIRGPLCPGCR